MGWYIGAGIVAVIVVLAVIISKRSGSFRIERSTQINAPATGVFPLINDFHQWTKWSPWEKIDPNLQRTYAGADSGPGAVYSWVGNKKVGEGRMTIQDSRPGELVSIKLEFLKPFAATNQATFTLSPSGKGTRVNWAMEGGQDSFMCKAFSLIMPMDKMVGKDFEKGLAQIKAAAEADAQ